MNNEKQEDLEFSDIGRDLKRFPHGWWIAPLLLLDTLVILLILFVLFY